MLRGEQRPGSGSAAGARQRTAQIARAWPARLAVLGLEDRAEAQDRAGPAEDRAEWRIGCQCGIGRGERLPRIGGAQDRAWHGGRSRAALVEDRRSTLRRCGPIRVRRGGSAGFYQEKPGETAPNSAYPVVSPGSLRFFP